jgi:hypothetical protein
MRIIGALTGKKNGKRKRRCRYTLAPWSNLLTPCLKKTPLSSHTKTRRPLDANPSPICLANYRAGLAVSNLQSPPDFAG